MGKEVEQKFSAAANFSVLLSCLSLITLIVPTVLGSCTGLYLVALNSLPLLKNGFLLPRAYFAGTIVFSIFFFSIMLAFLLPKMTGTLPTDIINKNATDAVAKSFAMFTGSTAYGIVAYYSCVGIGKTTKYFMRRMDKDKSMSVPFFLVLSLFEVLILFTMIIAILCVTYSNGSK